MHQQWLINEPEHYETAILLAHGAGAGMNHSFMNSIAGALCDRHILVVRFNFDYMNVIAETGRRRPPNRMPQLMACFVNQLAGVVEYFPAARWFVAGKSMGGRVASMVLNESDALGAICLGYPFHPPKKPEKTRLEPLRAANKPVLVLQGTRDALGSYQEVADYQLSEPVQVSWLEDGDHDLKPRKKSGLSQQDHINSAADIIQAFVVNP